MSPPTQTTTVAAGTGEAFELNAGDRIRVRNVHGSQVVDTWAFSRADFGEHLSMEHTRAQAKHIGIRAGMDLLTNRRRAILRVVADTSPGVHDTLIAACDPHRYRLLGVDGAHRNCTENLAIALSPFVATAATPCPLNLFMNIAVSASGELVWNEPVSRPGDTVELEACIDAVVVLSACPMDVLPINGRDCIPRAIVADVVRITSQETLS